MKREPSFTRLFRTHKYPKLLGNSSLWRLRKTKKSTQLDLMQRSAKQELDRVHNRTQAG